MSMFRIFNRSYKAKTVTIANGANLSDAIDMRDNSFLVIHMPAAWTAASVGFKVCATENGTYVPLYDENNALVQISGSTTDRAYSAPARVGGVGYVKLWSQDGSGGNTNQGAARSIIINKKA